jgi:hypothetical protein
MTPIMYPEKYHGRLVRVIGISSSWFTNEHSENVANMNSHWIEPGSDVLGFTRQQLEKFNGKYVLKEGVFNKDIHGYPGICSGALPKVARFQIWQEKGKTFQPTDALSLPATTPSQDLTVGRRVYLPLSPSNSVPTAEILTYSSMGSM